MKITKRIAGVGLLIVGLLGLVLIVGCNHDSIADAATSLPPSTATAPVALASLQVVPALPPRYCRVTEQGSSSASSRLKSTTISPDEPVIPKTTELGGCTEVLSTQKAAEAAGGPASASEAVIRI